MRSYKEQVFYHSPETTRKRIIASILVTLGVIVILTPFIWGFVADFIPIISYKFTPDEFEAIHGYSTSDFLKMPVKKRFASSSPYFDKNANFVVKLTYNENEELKEVAEDCLSKAIKNKNISISKDKKLIKVGFYKETVGSENMAVHLSYAITACNYSQLTKGIKPSDIGIVIQYYDIKTFEVIYSFNYGEDIYIDPEKFSSK